MGDPYPYGLPDFRQLIAGRTHHDPPEPPSLGIGGGGAAAAALPNTYDVVFPHGFASSTNFPHHHHHHHPRDYSSSVVNIIDPTNTNPTVTASASVDHGSTSALFCSSSSIEASEKGWLGFDATANNRWPRQETLSLLEIRSRLDSKFRDTNHKGPLWNEISRIMNEEYGYQRTGKKCKEKFENLYKYYKKTKEGKAGRQDGKHYRFFRQLEAICGETTTNTTTSNYQTPLMTMTDGEVLHHNNNNLKYCSKSLSLSNNSSDQFETSSSENNNDEDLSAIAYMMKQKGVEMDHQRESGFRMKKSLRAEVEELVDSHMRKIMETQDAWMEKMMSVVEQREQEMAYKEELRKKDSMRFDREVHQLWDKERAWIATRDAALMEVVKKHLGKELLEPMAEEHEEEEEEEEEPRTKNNNNNSNNGGWTELEISNLIQLRSGFEMRLQESGGFILENNNNGVWDEIAAKMAYLGFERSASECKQIWSDISISLNKTAMECSSNDSVIKTRPLCVGLQLTEDDISHSSSNAGTRDATR